MRAFSGPWCTGNGSTLLPVPGVPAEDLAFTVDFHRGPQGFIAGIADYPPANADIYELTSDYRGLPPPLESQSALFISGVNNLFVKCPPGPYNLPWFRRVCTDRFMP